MELKHDIRIVVIAQLDDENCIEPSKTNFRQQKIRFNEKLKAIPELYSINDENHHDGEYIDGYKMKYRFMKSEHMSLFTQEKDRLIEITEPVRNQAYIDIYKIYSTDSFDLSILSVHITHKSILVNDWWTIFTKLIKNDSTISKYEKQVEILCAPAFTLPLPKQLAHQADCLIKFYDTFKAHLFSMHSFSVSNIFTSQCHILPVIQLSFRPQILNWFYRRIENHKRLKEFLNANYLCLVACGPKRTSFKYDFSLFETNIILQFNSAEIKLNTLVEKFAMKYLNCSLDNYFLRTSILWICEIHDLEYYHDIFEVWISFMRDVCRKRFLSHYFLENENVYEEHIGFNELIHTIDYKNIDLYVNQLDECFQFPYVYQYNDRMKMLLKFFQSQPVFAFKMKMIYNVTVKSEFPNSDGSLNEMCSIICHLSFLEDDDKGNRVNFWSSQWKPLFIDYKRDDIVLKRPIFDYTSDQLAQQMTMSVYKLIQLDLNRMIHFNIKEILK